jgi:mRNA interferase MazF
VTARRGEIWLVDLGEPMGREQAGRRPALIVSDDEVNDSAGEVVIVVPVTSARRGLPSHVEIDDDGSGLDQVSYAKCEDVKSVSTLRLVTRLGQAPFDVMFGVERALRFVLAL